MSDREALEKALGWYADMTYLDEKDEAIVTAARERLAQLEGNVLVINATGFDWRVLSAALDNKGDPLAEKIVWMVARRVLHALDGETP